MRGGPATYRSGDGFRTWTIELASHAPGVCRHLHPVVVLVDRTRVLRPGQVRLAFHDGTRWRPVHLAHTDRDENIGAFEPFPDQNLVPGPAGPAPSAGSSGFSGFSGFTLRPGQKRSVRVRLAFTADARADDMAAMTAVVQRRGDDGDWVGRSGWYAFSVAAPRG
jgi:hypothetical protein